MRLKYFSILAFMKGNFFTPNRKLFLDNIIWLSVDKFLRLVIGVVVGAWVARYLGPADFGLLSYALVFCSFFSAVATLGLDGIVVRELSTSTQQADRVMGTAFCLRFIAGIILFGASVLAIMAIESSPTLVNITIIIALGLLFQSADVIELWFQSQSQSKKTIFSRGVAYLVANTLKVLIVVNEFSLIYFAIVTFIEIFVSSGILFASYKRVIRKIQWIFDGHTAILLLKESWPYLLSTISILIYMRIDQVMIRALAGNAELGIYSAAVGLSSIFNAIPMILVIAAGPIAARLSAKDSMAFKKLLCRLFSLIWWSMLTIGVVIFLFSEIIISGIYGSHYIGASDVLAVHIFTNLPIGLGVIQSLWIINEKKSSLVIYRTCIGAVVNISLNFLLIPIYGSVGAAIASLSAQSISAIFSNILFAPEIFKLQLKSIFFIKNKA